MKYGWQKNIEINLKKLLKVTLMHQTKSHDVKIDTETHGAISVRFLHLELSKNHLIYKILPSSFTHLSVSDLVTG
jgi:hypothetical protein